MPIEIQTAAELRERLKAAALLATSRLSEASFQPGYVADMLLGTMAALGEECERISAQHYLATFIRTASGDDLDQLASDHYGITRRSGVAAIGEVQFSRPTAAAGPVLIPAGTLVASPSGQQFVTTEEPLMLGLTAESNIEAVVQGPSGNVAPNTITSLLTTLIDGTITITNAQQTVGGSEAETDDEYRERIFSFFPTLRRGTAFALKTGALSVGGVASATVDDLIYPPTVYIADVGGGANDALVEAVVAELENWRAAGVPVNVIAASPTDVPVSATLIFETGFDTIANRTAIAEAIATTINSLETGETLYLSTLVASAFRAVSGLRNIGIVTPAANVTPLAYQLLRSSAALVTLA